MRKRNKVKKYKNRPLSLYSGRFLCGLQVLEVHARDLVLRLETAAGEAVDDDVYRGGKIEHDQQEKGHQHAHGGEGNHIEQEQEGQRHGSDAGESGDNQPGLGGRQAGEQVLYRAKDAGGDGQEDQKNNKGHGDGHTIHSFFCLRYS